MNVYGFSPIQVGSTWIRLASEEGLERSRVRVRLEHSNGSATETELPYLSHGIAGGRFVGSPSGRFVVVSVCSGQSEEGFGLVDVAASELLWWSGYQNGEVASFAFDPAEENIVMIMPDLCGGWWLPWEHGDEETLDDGSLAFDFGTVLVHHIGSQSTSSRRLRFRVSAAWTPPVEVELPDYLDLRVSDERIQVEFPWGQETLALSGTETVWLFPGGGAD